MANLRNAIKLVKIEEIKEHPDNPRSITADKFKKLVKSIQDFPEMLTLRPLVIDSDGFVLGGNMRLKACRKVGLKEIPVIDASELSEEQKKEFVIKDNVGFGEWDWDALANEWESEKLDEWGLEIPSETKTEGLSAIEFEDIYYTPKEEPNVKLIDTLDFTKFDAKIKIIEDSNLTNDQKHLMKWFTYRFVKINFEQVANYYYFKATDEEKPIMERLRLVLCDGGVDGFIDDDILRIHKTIEAWDVSDEDDD